MVEWIGPKAQGPSVQKRRAGDSSSGPPRPTFNKVVMCLLGNPSSARAPSVPARGAGGMDLELLVVEVAFAGELLLGILMVTDEALMEEASKYSVDPKTSFFLELRGSSSSPPLWGHVEVVGVSKGISSGVEGELGRFPLCVVRNGVVSALDGWSEPSWGSVDAV